MAKITFTLPITGGEGSGVTNLSYTASPTDGTVNSDTGADASIPLADATNAGLLSPAEKIKLNNTSGINNGDQTSIAGITGTKTQFNTAVTDGDFLFVGDVIAYTDEQAQDAVGNILVGSPTIDFTYDDSTPNITATVKTNSITATELSNSINISEFINDSDYATINYVDSHSNRTDNPHNVTKSQIGLGNVDNTSDLNKPISIATQTALDLKENKSEKNQINGYAGLDGSGKIFSNQLPALAITDTFVVNSQATMLNLTTAEIGDIAVRTDLNKTFILKGLNYSILTDWQELITPTDSVSSVFGRSGAVIANVGDYTTALVTETVNKNYQTDNQKLFNDATSSIQTQLNNRELIGINSIAEVYVETSGNDSTAVLGNQRKPYLTIDAALDALPAGGGVIKIGVGSFSSPDQTKIKSNTAFIGSKEPVINSTVTISAPNTRPTISAPTALINGTILTGGFLALNKSNITVQNLGIDVGKTWVDTFNGGVTVEGLVIASITATAPVKNITVNNVTALGYSPATAQHCMLFENIIDSKFNNLTTYYNVHGVVIKGLSVNVDGINAYSHKDNGLIIKSDMYASTRDVSVNNVNISSLSGYEGGGIILEEWVNGLSLLERVSLNNINLKHVKFGLNNVNKVSSVNISNFNLYDSNTFGIKFDNNIDKINLSGLNIVKTSTNAIDVSVTGSAVVNIVNSSVSDATGIGYKLTTAGNALINLVNSNTLNTTVSYSITGTGIYGSSNFGTGTTAGYIKFNNSFVRSDGRIFSTNDNNFGDLAFTNGSLDLHFSNSAQKGTIESYNFSTASPKPLEIRSLNYNVTTAGAVTATTYTGGASLTGDPTAPTAAAGTNNLTIANTAFVNNLVSSGSYTPTISANTNCVTPGALLSTYTRIGNIITLRLLVLAANFTAANTQTTMTVNLPINRTLNDVKSIGCGSGFNASGDYWAAIAQTVANNNTMLVSFKTPSTNGGNISLFVQYDITK